MTDTLDTILREIEQDDAMASRTFGEMAVRGFAHSIENWRRDRENLKRAVLALKAAEEFMLSVGECKQECGVDKTHHVLWNALSSFKAQP